MTYPTECPGCSADLVLARRLPVVHTMSPEGELVVWIECPLCTYLAPPLPESLAKEPVVVADDGTLCGERFGPAYPMCARPEGHTGMHSTRRDPS